MGAGENRIFKISLRPSLANPCPILVIRMSIEQGPVDLYISNREVPAQGKQARLDFCLPLLIHFLMSYNGMH